MRMEFWSVTPNGIPFYQQLYARIRASIVNGEIAPGERMPSIRRLSEELNLSRTTIEAAYQQLCVEGYLKSRPQSGYYAAEIRMHPDTQTPEKQHASRPPDLPPIRYRFSTSAVDRNAFRVDLWRRYLRNVLNEPDGLLSYGEPQGEIALREAISDYYNRVRGGSAVPEQIVIGAGIQPLLMILCGLIRSRMPTIAMEAPGFLQAEQIFFNCGFPVIHSAVDHEGLYASALRACGATAAYVNPSNRYFSGNPLSLARRLELLEWASEGNVLIEDDNNGELRYRARPIPAMQGLDPAAPVFYLGTFSKVLMPAVRMGYLVLPRDFLQDYYACRDHYNQTASKTEQLALAQYIHEGQLERQLRKMRKIYSQKGDLLLKSLKKAFPDAEIILQETALRVLLRPAGAQDATVLSELAARAGIIVRPYGDPANGQLSIGFSGIPQEEIEPGIDALRKSLKGT